MNCHLQIFLLLIGGLSLVFALAGMVGFIAVMVEERFGPHGVIITLATLMVLLVAAISWVMPCHESMI